MIDAARYLGVPPWDLIDQSAAWLFYAEASMNAEARAAEIIQRRNERRAKRGST